MYRAISPNSWRSCSTKNTSLAPLEGLSSQSAPKPANRSGTDVSSMLSLTLSEVGLVNLAEVWSRKEPIASTMILGTIVRLVKNLSG